MKLGEKIDQYIEKDDRTEPLECSICGEVIEVEEVTGWDGGHNAEPINEGRCCSKCNMEVVVPARIKQIKDNKDKETKYEELLDYIDTHPRKCLKDFKWCEECKTFEEIKK